MANFYDDIFEAFDETEETEPCSEPVVNKQGIKTEEILKLAENSDQTRLSVIVYLCKIDRYKRDQN